MSEDIGDEQTTWHDDFTTASQWEIFIARLEEVIYDWKLPHLKIFNLSPRFKHAVTGKLKYEDSKIYFSDVEFIVTHFHREVNDNNTADDELSVESPVSDDGDETASWGQELLESDILDELGDGDGSDSPHCLERWYGLHNFLILSPSLSPILSESQAKLLLSSVQIAISNTRCPIPVFVQIQHLNQMFFIGTWDGPGIRSEFSMINLRNAPRHYRYLTGLLDIFKGKLAASTTIPTHSMLTPVQVSARLRFCLKDWPMNSWTQPPPDLELLQGQIGISHIGKLPFGAEADPINELQLIAQWRSLPESVLVDRDGYTDLAPTLASRWSIKIILSTQRQGLLAKTLDRMLSFCTSSATAAQLLGSLVHASEEIGDLADPLSRLTEPKVPSFSKLLSSANRTSKQTNVKGPIPDGTLMTILYYLFPDAEDKQSNPYPESLEPDEPKIFTFKPNERGNAPMKTAPCDSLIWRLAIVMALVIDAAQGGLRAGAHLWHEVVLEMRYRWSNAHLIPGLMSGHPDMRSCLLYQKLQMLNYCIEKRIYREKRAKLQAEGHQSDSEFQEVESSDEDEFYECDEDAPERAPKKEHSLWNQPVGRLSRHGNLRLLDAGEPIYIPITQEPPPKTEDQRYEDAEVLMQLGSDAAGSELRAQIMSPLLLSDMEAFKAANPGACLGDFVRWYSPRDWIEEENKLSARMLIEGNHWQELWKAAKPVPASRQKRLFDDTREAEKVLHYLESQKPADVFKLLLPVLVHAVVNRISDEWREELSPNSFLINLQERASRITSPLTPTLSDVKAFVSLLSKEEIKISQWTSLIKKLSEDEEHPDENLSKIVCDLLYPKEVEVPDGPNGTLGNRIKTMFYEAEKTSHLIPDESEKSDHQIQFPPPKEREFLLRVKACVPSPTSTPSPQRMYAVIRDDSFRIAAAFSTDTIFS